ncbi:hypothetical protein K502DRAFT_367815 [Neoconidiobolus thromboides FSU 785]|nr:hypothetical protein K502DRAFT_367815 [Neoconidiobolus thromboides FSU 785]
MKRIRKSSSPMNGEEVSDNREEKNGVNSSQFQGSHQIKRNRPQNPNFNQFPKRSNNAPFDISKMNSRIPNFNCPIPLKSVCSAYISFVENTANPIVLNSLISKRKPNAPPQVLLIVIPKLDRLFMNSIETMARKPFPVNQLTPNISLLGSPDYALYVTTLFKRYFSYGCVTECSGTNRKAFSPLVDLLQIKQDEPSARVMRAKAELKEKCEDPRAYIMTKEIFISKGWTLPLELSKKANLPQGWIQTTSYSPNGPNSPIQMLAIDCEMCLTTKGRELTRVTIMNFNGEIVLDELVKPENPVVDYLTKYSGMSEQKLNNAKYTQKDIQLKLAEIFNSNTIMLGHGLTNDLEAIKIVHPYIIDTAVIFSHYKGPPYLPGLKWLAETLLKRSIQGGIISGHDSIEDCKTVIDLVALKLKEYPSFGLKQSDMETIFSRFSRLSEGKIRSAVADYNSLLPFTEGASMYYPCTNDKQVHEHIIEALNQGVNMVMGRFQALDVDFENLGTEGQKVNLAFGTNDLFDNPQKVLGKFLRSFESLLKKVPSDTIIIATSGHSHNPLMDELNHKFNSQYEWMNSEMGILPDQIWTKVDEVKLSKEVQKARLGLTFFGLASDFS